jgi:hypothetical protein
MKTLAPLRVLLLLMGLLALANTARADCSSPAGIAGDIIYSANYNVPAYCNGSSWVTLAGGTTSGGGGGGATPAGSLNDVQFNNGTSLGADTGNFTYSSGLLTAPGISTGNVSATTLNATDLGTMGSLLVAGGATVTGQASLTVISTSLIQVGNNGASCTSGLAGGVRYNSISNTIDYCSGSAWLSLGPSATVVPSFFVTRGGTDQTVTSGVETRVSFTTKVFDTNNNFDTATGKFTPTVPGKYVINASIWCRDATTSCYALLRKNGSNIAQQNMLVAAGEAAVNTIVDMNGTTDYVTMSGQNNGGTVFDGHVYTTFMTGAMLTMNGGGSGSTANPAGSTNDVQFNSGGLLAADTGNFTYASSTLTVPSVVTGGFTATGVASLTTVSASNISSSIIQVGNNGSSCTSGLAGGLRYNGTSNTIDYCSGSAWLSLGPSATVPISWSANKSAAQTLSVSGWNKITGWTKDFDTNGDFGSDAYTVSVPGKYLLTASLRVQMAGAGTISVGIYKNGTLYRYDTQYSTATGPNVAPVVAVVADAVAGDKFEVYAWTGNTSNSVYADASSNYFTGALLSPQGGGSGGTANPAGSTDDVQFNSAGLLAADTGKFTYTATTGTLSATTISTTALNIASVTSVISLNGGSGNMISSGSAVVSTSSSGNIGIYTNGQNAVSIDGSPTIQMNGQVIISTSLGGAGLEIFNQLSQRLSERMTAGGIGMIYGWDVTNSSYLPVNIGGDGTTVGKGLYVDGNGFAFLGGTSSYAGNNAKLMINYEGGGTRHGITLHPAADTTNAIDFLNAAGTRIGSITQNTTATAFNTSSDRRVKENITEAREGLQKLLQLPVRDFSFRKDPSHTIVTGFIAQEVEQVFPEAVTTNGDNGKVPLKDENNIWQVDYGRVTPLIVKAVQDLKAIFDADHAEVLRLKAANDNFAAVVKAQQRQIDALTAANRTVLKRMDEMGAFRRATSR